jgi:hypothetical protein
MLRGYLPTGREMRSQMNEQKMLVKFGNGSMLQLGGSDDPDSLKGIDAIGAVLDEWSLHKSQTWTEVFRPIIAGPIPPHLAGKGVFRWAAFLYTPKGMNHATVMFDDAICRTETGVLPECGEPPKVKARWFCSRLNAEQAGIIPTTELEEMRADPNIPLSLYQQEMLCSRVADEEMTLITSAMLDRLNSHHAGTHSSIEPELVRKIVSIDPAFGGDTCQMYGLIDGAIAGHRTIIDRYSTEAIAMAGKILAQEIGTRNIIVDSIGSGLGVADHLAADAARYNVQYFNSSERPLAQAKRAKKTAAAQVQFGNRRAEAYFYAAGGVRLLRVGPIADDMLLRQLPASSRYSCSGSGGRLLISPKQVIRKELGCSPDHADCWVMGIWGLQFVDLEPRGEYSFGVIEGSSVISGCLPYGMSYGL